MDVTSPLNTIQGVGKHIVQQLSFPLDKIFIDFSLVSPTKIKINVVGNEKVVFIGAK